MKTCSRCKEEKDESLFCKNRTTNDGLDYFCKICRRESSKKWRLDNTEKVEEYNRTHPRDKAYMVAKATKWANANREKVRECYRRHREARIAYAQDYLSKNKELVNKRKNELYSTNKLKYLCHSTRFRLKKSLCIEPSKELVETVVLINQTRQLCKTLNN